MIYFNLIIPMYEYVEYPIYLIPYFLKCRILIVLEERIKVNGELCTMRGKKIFPGDRVQIDEIKSEIVVE